MAAQKHFIVWRNKLSELEFCTELLQTGEFSEGMLREAGARGSSKEDLAKRLAEMVVQDKVDHERVMKVLCRRPRRWFTFRLGGPPEQLPEYESAKTFLTKRGKQREHWFGPFKDPTQGVAYYVVTQLSPHWEVVATGEPLRRFFIRWHGVIAIAHDHVSMHWHNFMRSSHSEEDEGIEGPIRSNSFPYWKYVPRALSYLGHDCGANWRDPKLHDIVLHRLLGHFDGLEGHEWSHIAVRNDQGGLSFAARGGKIKTLKIDGIRDLANQFADAACRGAGVIDVAAIEGARRAVLRTLLREQGTLSYEWRHETTMGERISRAHCYFGGRPEPRRFKRDGKTHVRSWRQDSFPHVKTWGQWGGSLAALDFLLRHVRED